MTLLRLLILAVVIALGTVLVDWWIVAIAGLAYGVLSRSTRYPGTMAAAAAVIAWGGYLALTTVGGAPVRAFGANLARSLEVPGWVPLVATLAFPAVLAGSASWLGARLGAWSTPKRRQRR
jgi:hypothetical protein